MTLISVLPGAVGLVVGVLVFWLLRRVIFSVRRRRRPPKGTRPDVRLVHLGVTYDLTESLLRVDDRDGRAVWIVLGPPHVQLRETIELVVRQPEPRDTRVQIQVKSDEGADYRRFLTLEELQRSYPELR